MAELESPASADELYLYRGDEVPRTRPMFQGDVFDEVAIPGLDDGPGLAMIITHACTMREGPSLSITAVCGCGDDFCASFYTGPRPDGSWGAQHRNVTPETATGMVILDVVDGRIRCVEVLHRDDVKSVISALTEQATEARTTLRPGRRRKLR